MNTEAAMRIAIDLAKSSSINTDDVPVGAVILNSSGEVVSTGTNERELNSDPSGHAEIVAMRKAGKSLENWRLDAHTLVVTLEPCAMCAGAIAQSRMAKLVFGAWDEKAGAVGSVWDILRDPRALNRVEVVSGVLAGECAQMLATFFQEKRKGI
ncbi:MAG TPA: tRNA adenosine(34) deaminase TadA [Candidatus Paceibacterota bacterium]|nr:tRNA adenosine(34) deaminase TadA [Candidatus Paceibacterota bacterium]